VLDRPGQSVDSLGQRHPVGWASFRQAVAISQDWRWKERPVDEAGTARRPLSGLTEPHINPSSAERARVKSKRLNKLERAGRIPGPACAPARSGCEGLTALLHPKLVQQVDIRLTPLVVGGPEFFPDVLLELLGAGASLDFLQLDLMLKIDVAKRPRDLFHHQVKAGRVHSGLLVGVIGHVSLHDCSSLF